MRYCSRECCCAHWKAHKAECRRIRAERAAAEAAAAVVEGKQQGEVGEGEQEAAAPQRGGEE